MTKTQALVFAWHMLRYHIPALWLLIHEGDEKAYSWVPDEVIAHITDDPEFSIDDDEQIMSAVLHEKLTRIHQRRGIQSVVESLAWHRMTFSEARRWAFKFDLQLSEPAYLAAANRVRAERREVAT